MIQRFDQHDTKEICCLRDSAIIRMTDKAFHVVPPATAGCLGVIPKAGSLPDHSKLQVTQVQTKSQDQTALSQHPIGSWDPLALRIVLKISANTLFDFVP